MKINIKILIICLFLVLSSIPATYAYWTDKVNTEININIAYDANLNVLNVPPPVIVPMPAATIPLLEEPISQIEGEVLDNSDTGAMQLQDTEVLNTEIGNTVTEGEDNADLNSMDQGSPDMETEGEDNDNLNSIDQGSPDMETEGEDNADLNSIDQGSPDMETNGEDNAVINPEVLSSPDAETSSENSLDINSDIAGSSDTESSENNNSGSESPDVESEDTQDSHAENEQ